MKRLLIVFFSIFLIFEGVCMASPIAKTWVYATVLVENEWGGSGTGFLVLRKINDKEARIFLVTNKHVLNKKKELRNNAKTITCRLNVKTGEGTVVGKSYSLELVFPDGSKRWREHPDDIVEVLVFDVTDLIVQNPEIEKKWASYELFADQALLSSQEITIGEEIVVVGYPLGIKQGKTNFPLVRQGIIATQIGQPFIEDTRDNNGQVVQKTYRGFLIDGGVIPGSSGSPVVLKPVSGRSVGNSIRIDLPEPYLLGIIAETRFAPIRTSEKDVIPSYAGLGLAFDAATIKETIEIFFK